LTMPVRSFCQGPAKHRRLRAPRCV
jgi:hypothetical protein